MTAPRKAAEVTAARFRAVVFDLDGVTTDTAAVHFRAWTRLFDEYLHQSGTFTLDDYRRYVDGKPRYDGVRSFLASRGITIDEGSPDDPVDRDTVCGLGNRKDGYFHDAIRADGVEAFPDTLAFIHTLHDAGVRTAIFSASRNCREVLEAAGIADLFEARVDGVVADELGLPGKPDPAVPIEAARRIGATPDAAAIVEDALAGVEAGR